MFVSRKFLAIILIFSICFLHFKPQAKAMDPVTIAILAPYAIKAAEVMAPYVMRGLSCGAKGLVACGKDTLEILYLPLGIVQSTLLAPFGGLGSGISNIFKGCIAPFKLAVDVLVLPIKFLGVSM